MRALALGLIGAVVLAGAGQGAPVTQSEARKFLFPTRGADLVVLPGSGLDAAQQVIVGAILKQVQSETGANYYGALAVSPAFFDMMAADPGQAALSGLLQIAEQFHTAEAAAAMALAACDKARKARQAKCVDAARVLPRKWTARPLQMSRGATLAFRDYRKASKPKAMAISPGSTAFALARGESADATALASCNAKAQAFGMADCQVVIKD